MINIDNILMTWRSNYGKSQVAMPISFTGELLKSLIDKIGNNRLVLITTNKYIKFINTIKDDYNLSFIVYTNINNINANDYIVTVGVDCNVANTIKDISKFYLLINNEEIYKNIPIIKSINSNICKSPVGELMQRVELLPIVLTESEQESYSKFDDYIIQSMQIFGNFDVIPLLCKGDYSINKSAMECCRDLAYKNGWNETLSEDDNEFNKKIDSVYSPSAIYNRAINIYNICRSRNAVIQNAYNKQLAIANIIKEHDSSSILIISKTNSVANDISEFLDSSYGNMSVSINNDMPSRSLLDDDGEPIIYKTGKNKGSIKLFGKTLQTKYFCDKFNTNTINLSITDKTNDLDLYVGNVMILTSPSCLLKPILYRMNDCLINPKKIYVLYVINSNDEGILKRNNFNIDTEISYDNSSINFVD